jgi:molecular chaperone GrpE
VTDRPHGATDESVEVSEDETPAGSSGDAAAETADEPSETPRPSAPREPTEVEGESGQDSVSEGPSVERQLEERTADLQRLQAEYLNYKRRVDRDRELVRENATYHALAPIIDVLDNIDRAREHGPLEDGFRGVAEQLERVVAAQGLVKFGEPGDAFDPTVHEALSHIGTDPDVEVTTCKVIAKAGYRIGERVVRAAQVLVVDPGERDEAPANEM